MISLDLNYKAQNTEYKTNTNKDQKHKAKLNLTNLSNRSIIYTEIKKSFLTIKSQIKGEKSEKNIFHFRSNIFDILYYFWWREKIQIISILRQKKCSIS